MSLSSRDRDQVYEYVINKDPAARYPSAIYVEMGRPDEQYVMVIIPRPKPRDVDENDLIRPKRDRTLESKTMYELALDVITKFHYAPIHTIRYYVFILTVNTFNTFINECNNKDILFYIYEQGYFNSLIDHNRNDYIPTPASKRDISYYQNGSNVIVPHVIKHVDGYYVINETGTYFMLDNGVVVRGDNTVICNAGTTIACGVNNIINKVNSNFAPRNYIITGKYVSLGMDDIYGQTVTNPAPKDNSKDSRFQLDNSRAKMQSPSLPIPIDDVNKKFRRSERRPIAVGRSKRRSISFGR